MSNTIVVLTPEDIPVALSLQSEISEAELWVYEPKLLDRLKAAGAVNVRFIDNELNFDTEQHLGSVAIQTSSIEKKIDEIVNKHIPEVNIYHWQYTNISLLLTSINFFAMLWDKLTSKAIDTKFHILMHNSSAEFSAPSFWAALLLMERLNARNISYSAYSYGDASDELQYIPVGTNFIAPEVQYQAFVHLPTCFYDATFFSDEIRESFKNVLNFQSMDVRTLNWNVVLPNLTTADLRSTAEASISIAAHVRDTFSQISQGITELLDDFFSTFAATREFTLRQSRNIAIKYEAQLIFYYLLNIEFSKKLPLKIILSNHDAGLHGPFMSFAKKYNIPVVLLPHSKVFNFPVVSSYSNIVALCHPTQGDKITNIEGYRIHSNYVTFPEDQRNSNTAIVKIKVVGIILNDITMAVMPEKFLDGLRRIALWCEDNGIKCKLRVRPGATCIQWLTGNMISNYSELVCNALGKIVDFSRDCDICIMYDCPTSGGIDLLMNSIPTLNTVFRPLSAMESSIICTKIVPRESVAETIARLNYYRLNPSELFAFRTQQYASYVAGFGQSLPLRMLL